MVDLSAAARELVQRKDFAVLVVKGAGAHFMAGGDLKDFARRLPLSAEARHAHFRALIEQHINTTVKLLQSLPQPVIASVRGACAGFGLALVAAGAPDGARDALAARGRIPAGAGGGRWCDGVAFPAGGRARPSARRPCPDDRTRRSSR